MNILDLMTKNGYKSKRRLKMDIKDDISSIRIRLLRMNNWAYKSAVKIAKMNDIRNNNDL